MYRKTQLAAGTASEGQSHIGRGSMASTVTLGEEDSLDSWADRTQTTITGVRKGKADGIIQKKGEYMLDMHW